MIRTLVDFALNNRFVVLAVALLLVAWGAVSFHNLPVEAYPEISDNYVTVITQWPGRAAEEVEQQVPVKITLDDAIQLALHHNYTLQAARTTIQQSQAQEITANLRPNPVLIGDWEYLPFFAPSYWTSTYLGDLTDADLGLSYLIERGKKRQHRLQAARDQTAVTTSLVADNERTLTYQVAVQFVNVQLAETTVELAQENLKSYQRTVDISEMRYKKGAISEDDYLKIDLQLLQFQNDLSQAQLVRVQALTDLRQLLGYESVSANYDVAGTFDYNPLQVNLLDLQLRALQERPDLRAAKQGVTAANSQYDLAKANGKRDVTAQVNYTHVNGINTGSLFGSIQLPLFDRNQGEIARTQFAIAQSQNQEKAANGQVMTDVRDAYENFQTSDHSRCSPSQNGHLFPCCVVHTLVFSSVLSLSLTKERALHFQLRRDRTVFPFSLYARV